MEMRFHSIKQVDAILLCITIRLKNIILCMFLTVHCIMSPLLEIGRQFWRYNREANVRNNLSFKRILLLIRDSEGWILGQFFCLGEFNVEKKKVL